MTTSIQNIIFDIGRVIVDYQEADVVRAVLPHSPHQEFYLEKFLKSDHWQRLDRGTLTVAEVIVKLAQHIPHPYTLAEDVQTIVHNFVGTLPLLPDSQQLFLDLAERYPIYILSNFQDAPFDQLLALHPFLKRAKGFVVSGKVRLMKPEDNIYQYLLQTFSLNPQSCLFLDDKEENIAAAKKQGMHGIVFKTAQKAKEDLVPFGIVF